MIAKEKLEILAEHNKVLSDNSIETESLHTQISSFKNQILILTDQKEDLTKDLEYMKSDLKRQNETKDNLSKEVGLFYKIIHFRMEN